MTQRENFERLWDSFIAKLKGQMINKSKQNTLSYSYVKLLLENQVYSWNSEYEEAGRWLMSYTEEYPRSGERIRDILLNDMSFTEIKPAKKSSVLNYAIPIVGAAAGLGISSVFNAGIIVKIISTVVPGVVLYPVTKSFSGYMNEYQDQRMIDEYIGQLNKYKISIISVLDDSQVVIQDNDY